ncbi:hypothetical protein BUALT_Bualt04G0091300 [Buddleja alternifolia]|uniref:Uncharacterized protein n=1 Tax=Buddleja alternifolia TaxID=168488 RepID=A0AAV6XYQ2_9LAMI|nr:hypothetical protein BUALT_Bualt04G0091300 [Buddleja alternifolia]
MENSGTKGVRKGAWTKEEDILLKKCIEKYGEGKWHLVPLRSGLNRCRKSCRLRWLNYLRPNIKRGYFSKDEVDLIKRLHKLLGNRWSLIAGRLPGRTANDVKNFWNTHIEKKLGNKEGNIEKEKVQKTITKSNIVRPQPRTFPKSHVMEASPINQTNDWTNKDENPNNKKPSSSTSSPQEEVDECIKWWSNLLQETELGADISPFSLSGEEDHQTEQIITPGLNNPVEQDGLSSLVLDVDCWELDSFHHQSFMPFN